MPTMEQYLTRPLGDRLVRLRATPDELRKRLHAQSDERLSRRPAASSWSVKEIVCHLRDVEELFLTRFVSILALDEPTILTLSAAPEALTAWRIGKDIGHPLDPERWAEERQYQRCDAGLALAAFARRRQESLTVLETLSPADWRRGGVHLVRGRMELGEWVASLASHDDNHLEQLIRALDGRP